MTIQRVQTFTTADLIARNEYPTGVYVEQIGQNSSVTGSSIEDMTRMSAFPTIPATAQQMDVQSSSANDADPAGTGVRKIRVVGLDGNLAIQAETVNLNGLTAVNLANSYRAILDAFAVEVGSGGVAAGHIVISEVVSGQNHRWIATGWTRQTDCYHVIPADHFGLVQTFGGYQDSGSAGGFLLIAQRYSMNDTDPAVLIDQLVPLAFAANGFDQRVEFRIPAGAVVGVQADNAGSGNQVARSNLSLTVQRV